MAVPAASTTVGSTQEPTLLIGQCYVCGSATGSDVRGTLDGRDAPVAVMGEDAVAVVRGRQVTTTFKDGSVVRYGTYDEVEARSAAIGRIESIDPARGRIEVQGQEVQAFGPWAGATVSSQPGLEPSLPLTSLAVGQHVRVNGYDVEGGVIVATGVHASRAGTADRVTGMVGRIDGALRRLAIGALEIDYSAATLEAFPDGEPRAGDRVEAIAAGESTERPMRAVRLVFRDAPLALAPGTRVRLYGLSRPRSAARLRAAAGVTSVAVGGEVVQLEASCRQGFSPTVRVAGLAAKASAAGTLAPGDDRETNCELRADSPSTTAFVTGALQPVAAGTKELRIFDVALVLQAGSSWFSAPGVAGDPGSAGVGDVVTVGVWPAAVEARGVVGHVTTPNAPVAAPAEARFEGWMPAPGTNRVRFLGRDIVLDSATKAGYRDCSVAGPQPLVAVDANGFVTGAYSRLTQRWIIAEVAADGSGGWRAVTIEANSNPYCD